MNTTSYQYSDGNANVYIITPDTLEYVPVKPNESSTGFYSGGVPKKVMLTANQFQHLVALIEAAMKNTDAHIPERIKGSGAIKTLTGSEKHSIFLKPGSVELGKIEAALKELLA
jgi:hypothetical protein